MQTPTSSEMVQFSWKMRYVLKTMKNQFSYLYFLTNGRFCSQFSNVFTLIPEQNCKKYIYYLKRCVMCWNEWKINFYIFIFRVTVKIPKIGVIWGELKNRNLKIDFSFDSAYCASVMKVGSKLREGVCISLVGTEPT